MLPSVAFVERHRGQVPLNFDEGRDQREEVCDEGVGLWGESQVSDDFLKIDDKTPDDRGRNHDKPGLNWDAGVYQRAVRLPTFTKHFDARGRRLALATTALRSPPMHPEDCLKGKSLGI